MKSYRVNRLKNSIKKKLVPLSGLLFIVVVLSFLTPHFLTVNNLFAIGVQTSVIALLGLGVTFVIITAGIDLSVGSVLALSAITTTYSMSLGVNIFLAIIIGLITGAICGLISGLVTSLGKIHSFIATLGMMGIARGSALLITGGQPVSGLPQNFTFIGRGSLGPVPVPVIILIVVALSTHFILTKTKVGRYTFALGSNKEAARLSGINIVKYKTLVFVISGFMAGMGGIVEASRLGIGQPTAGQMYELDAIAAAVIGGTSLLGGVGSISGTIIGAFIMGVLRNGTNLLGISYFVQEIIIGVIVIIACVYDRQTRTVTE